MSFVFADRVKETSTTTGTGSFSLAGAPTGFVRFADARLVYPENGRTISVGDTFCYAIVAVDSSGVPTGEWETGVGRYSAANTLARDSVSASSTGSKVSFSAGTKEVFITPNARYLTDVGVPGQMTLYVSASGGNDSNSGYSETSALQTISEAISRHRATAWAKRETFQGTIVLAAGTYEETLYVDANMVLSFEALGNVSLVDGGDGYALFVGKGAKVTVGESVTIQSAYGNGVFLDDGVLEAYGLTFGACSSSHIFLEGANAQANVGGINITGNAPCFIEASKHAKATLYDSITLSGTRAFSTAFIKASYGSVVVGVGTTYSGAATGVRYNASFNAVIHSGVTLPGGTAGVTSYGGQYA